MRHQARYQGMARRRHHLARAAPTRRWPGGSTRYKGRVKREDAAPAPHRDITLTKRWMDAIGVDVTCLFPTPMLSLGLTPRVEVEVALARAYNRWLIEHVPGAEPRIRSRLYLPFNDPDDMRASMVEEFGDKPGVIGFCVTAPRYKRRVGQWLLPAPTRCSRSAACRSPSIPASCGAATARWSCATASSRSMRWASPGTTSST